MENLRTVGIAVIQIAKDNLAFKGRTRFLDQSFVLDRWLSFQNLVDTNDTGGAALKQVHDPADGDHGPCELDHVDHELRELADRDVVQDDLMAADK